MYNKKQMFFAFDAFVEGPKFSDLSDTAICFWYIEAKWSLRHCILQEFQYCPCVGILLWRCVHKCKEQDTLCDVLVPSLGVDWCELSVVDRHHKIHQKVFHIWPSYMGGHGIDLKWDIFDRHQLCQCQLVHIMHQEFEQCNCLWISWSNMLSSFCWHNWSSQSISMLAPKSSWGSFSGMLWSTYFMLWSL